jgi:hypothetical protein
MSAAVIAFPKVPRRPQCAPRMSPEAPAPYSTASEAKKLLHELTGIYIRTSTLLDRISQEDPSP